MTQIFEINTYSCIQTFINYYKLVWMFPISTRSFSCPEIFHGFSFVLPYSFFLFLIVWRSGKQYRMFKKKTECGSYAICKATTTDAFFVIINNVNILLLKSRFEVFFDTGRNWENIAYFWDLKICIFQNISYIAISHTIRCLQIKTALTGAYLKHSIFKLTIL